MPSNVNNTYNEIYIYKSHKLYAKVLGNSYYRLKNDEFVLANDEVSEILDILPEGIDLDIMLNSFNAKEPIELLPYVRNTIGDFDFSSDSKKTNFNKAVLSNLKANDEFPCILDLNIDIVPSLLRPSRNKDISKERTQRFSLSGYQHKLQVSVMDGEIKDEYGDFILKPYSDDYPQIPENEHLNVSFMRELGFEVPFNALIYDDRTELFHYIIKRFDIDENGDRLPQISLNALMKSADKYKGSIDEVSKFLADKLDDTQKMLFLRYIYANALLYNNDLHKKNISFLFRNNKLVLSPVYDVINIYAVKRLGNEQCALPIRGHENGIRINYFKPISELIGLDFKDVRVNLQEIQQIYLDKYPKYIEKLFAVPKIDNIAGFKYKLFESHKKCLKIAKSEANNTSNQISNPSTDDLLKAVESAQKEQQARMNDKCEDSTQDSRESKNVNHKRKR